MYGSFSSSSGARSATGGSRRSLAAGDRLSGHPGFRDLRRRGGLSEDDERGRRCVVGDYGVCGWAAALRIAVDDWGFSGAVR